MDKNYTRLRKKARLTSALISVLLGLGVGVLELAVTLLVMKLTGKGAEAWLYISAVGVTVVTIPFFWFLLVPTDRRFAKRLDEEHALGERVRTMVAFRDSEDAFAVLQREDAEEKLGSVRFNPWRRGQLITLAVVLVLAVALLTTALVVPKRDAQKEPEQVISEFDKQFILAELSAIRSTVEKSLISDELKADTLEELGSLVTFVEAHDYLSEMKIEAIKSVIRIDAALDAENTALPLGERLSACTNTKLRELGAELAKLNGTGVQKKLGELKGALADSSADEISFVADELVAAIEASGADAASSLTSLLKNLASALRGCTESGDVDTAFGTVQTDAMNEVMLQSINKRVIETTVSRLCTLFGITLEELVNAGADEDIEITPPSQGTPGEDVDDGKKDENEEIGAGGIGTGDRVYGSNDMIYNPYVNDYVPYGQVLDEYNNRVLQMLADGRIPPDFEDFIQEYFRSLSAYEPEA